MTATENTDKGWGAYDAALTFAFGAAILASRIPGMLCDYELNVDESQLIAQVRRYWLDPLPWRSVNGDTGGPLNTWYLLAANRLGVPLEYACIHALSAATLAITVVLLVFVARRFFGAQGALLGGLMGTLWVCVHQISDFIQYASELFPILLVAVSIACLARSFRYDIAAAFVLGLMPWAKLQVVPIGMVVGGWLVARTLWPVGATMLPERKSVGKAALILLSATIPSILMVSAVVRGGAWEECRRAYFITNLYYAGEAQFVPFVKRALDCILFRSSAAPWFMGVFLAVLLVPWRRSIWVRILEWRGTVFLSAGTVVASVYAWARTPTEWSHYDFFLLPGLILATASLAPLAGNEKRSTGRFWIVALLCASAYLLVLAKPAVADASSLLAGRSKPQAADGMLAAVRTLSPHFRTLDVWGWRPSIYVRGRLTPPTRQANCAFLFTDNPNRDFLRAANARDLEASLPDIILDTGGMSFEKYWHGMHAVETSEVGRIISAHYMLRGTVDAEDGTAYVYALRAP
jgi:hypothetical protein